MLRLYLKYSGGPAMAFWLLFAAATMASALTRAAVVRLRHLPVRPHTSLRDPAPKQAGVAGRHRGIRLRPDVLALPVQSRTQSRTFRIQMIRLLTHATPPAFRMARFTATRARWIF